MKPQDVLHFWFQETPPGKRFVRDAAFDQTIRERFGEARLTSLLEGYTEANPFLVVSDAFPAGWVPRPQLPDFLLGIDGDPAQRKTAKKKVWLPVIGAALPLADWLARAAALKTAEHLVLTQNTINRFTGTTGSGPWC